MSWEKRVGQNIIESKQNQVKGESCDQNMIINYCNAIFWIVKVGLLSVRLDDLR